jgi:ubiquinone/menaquinone biosynthesis C-methylase UbiE
MNALPHIQLQQHLTPQRIIQMGWAFVLPLAIESAVRYHFFDVLDGKSLTLTQVCKQTHCSERGAVAVMDLLVSVELLSKDKDGKYTLTPESATFLVSGKPFFHGGFFRHLSQNLMPSFLQLDSAVRTGIPVRSVDDKAEGESFFKSFVEDLMPMNFPAAQAVARELLAHRQAETTRILDLAAGSGVWGVTISDAFPKATLTAVDLPAVLEVTRSVVQRFNLDGRYTDIAGDLLEVDFGRGYSVAILGHILHSEGEERGRRLLSNTYSAMERGGTIVIPEFLLDDDRTTPTHSAIFNVNMLVNTSHGRSFTLGELREWLEELGFRNIRTLEVPAPSPVILAEK